MTLAVAPPDAPAVLRMETRLRQDEATVFFGCNASQIVVRWCSLDGESVRFRETLDSWILGSILGLATTIRGLPTLHGSVVAVDGRAIGLLGGSGAGKSTLAAAFVAAGHAMVADDHLVIRREAGGFAALPGPPRLRLWPASTALLDLAPDSLPRVEHYADKRYVDVDAGRHARGPVPLSAIYILMPRDPGRHVAAIEPLPARRALYLLLAQRFSTTELSRTHTAAIVEALSAVAQTVPVRLLYRPHGLPTLPEVVSAVTADSALAVT
jgi:hypothetical protein